MIKKDVIFKLNQNKKEDFIKIKKSIAIPPSLKILDFCKKLLFYTFTSNLSTSTVLNQKNERGDEVPFSFMSFNL